MPSRVTVVQLIVQDFHPGLAHVHHGLDGDDHAGHTAARPFRGCRNWERWGLRAASRLLRGRQNLVPPSNRELRHTACTALADIANRGCPAGSLLNRLRYRLSSVASNKRLGFIADLRRRERSRRCRRDSPRNMAPMSMLTMSPSFNTSAFAGYAVDDHIVYRDTGAGRETRRNRGSWGLLPVLSIYWRTISVDLPGGNPGFHRLTRKPKRLLQRSCLLLASAKAPGSSSAQS